MRVSTTTALLLLLAGAVIAVTLWWDQPGGSGDARPVMWRIETAEVRSFELRHASGIARRFDRQASGWSAGDSARIDAALLLLAAPEAARRLQPDGGGPASYGLEPPLLRITLSGPASGPAVIAVGDPTPDGSQHYVRRLGDDAVFLVAKSWFEALLLLLPEAGAVE